MSLQQIEDKIYCFLDGDLDKSTFSYQCDQCNYRSHCHIVYEFMYNIPGDWHALNTLGFYGDTFKNCKDKVQWKIYRDNGKGCGLALTYGGTAWTLHRNLGVSQDEAEVLIENFFKLLNVLKLHMLNTTRNVLASGTVANLFGRRRDVSYWSHPDPERFKTRKEIRSMQGFAKRTALNFPIQSTSADFLKLAMVRVQQYIRDQKKNPLSKCGVDQKIDLKKVSYRDVRLAELMTVHDEVVYLVHQDHFFLEAVNIYPIMQLKDIVQTLNCSFPFFLDVEFDKHRSYTSTSKIGLSRILFDIEFNRGKKRDLSAEVENVSPQVELSIEPNAILVQASDLTEGDYIIIEKYSATKSSLPENGYLFVVQEGDYVFSDGCFYTKKLSEELSCSTEMVYIQQK